MAIGIAAYYAKALSADSTVTLLHYHFVARDSLALLALCGAGLLAAFFLSAIFTYISDRQSIRLRFLYQEHCSRRVLQLLKSDLFVWNHSAVIPANLKTGMRLIRGDSMFLGRVLQSIVSAIVPAVTSVLSLVTLFYYDFLATFLVLTVVFLSIYFLYLVNVGASHQSRLVETQLRHWPVVILSNSLTSCGIGIQFQMELKINLMGFSKNLLLFNRLIVHFLGEF